MTAKSRTARASRASGGRGARGTLLRRHNLATIVGHLHLDGATSRSELATLTGLNRSTIADLVDELVGLGLAEEAGAVAGPGPGRPSPIVRPRPDSATVLAIELKVESFAVATIGLGGQILDERHVDAPMGPTSPRGTVTQIARTARPLVDALPASSLVGVGVGVAGLTRRTDGFVHLAPNLGWRDVPLADLVTEALGVRLPTGTPVLVANEADLGALGEHRRGAGRGVDDLMFVSAEVGIGTGVITAGTPLLGAAGYAGEAGHMLINPNGRVCGCGARGCWETEAGEAALLRRAAAPPDAHGRGAIDQVLTRADEGDRVALDAVAETGWWLGLGVGGLVNLVNPRLLVLGGHAARLLPRFEESLRAGLTAQALAAAEQLVEIVPSALDDDAALVGAAELAFDGLLSDPAGLAPAATPA